MSVYSMTGYANASAQASPPPDFPGVPEGAPRVTLQVELRSVNSRFLDLSLKIPDEMRGLEPALRELLTAQFRRGKIELRLHTQSRSSDGPHVPAGEQLQRLRDLQHAIQQHLPQAAALSVHEVLQWCKAPESLQGVDEAVLGAAREAVQGLKDARAREGSRLKDILLARIADLRQLAAQAEPLVPQVVEKQQQRFLEKWQAALASAGAGQTLSQETMQERALSEAAAFAIRIDVGEELARLRAHLDEITRLLTKGGEAGKRLDFLIQELHREANTLGSKSVSTETTQASVELKVLIEQMPEQIQNIE